MKRALCAIALLSACFATTAGEIDAWAAKAKAQAVGSLKDPESVRFRNLFVSRWKDHGTEKRALCGELNARNSMGGYRGFQRFVADESGAVVDNVMIWDEACAHPIKRL